MSKTFGLHMADEFIKPFQRLLNESLGIHLTIDGNIGKITQEAICQFQKNNGITEVDEHGPVYGEKTQAIALPIIEKRFLKEQDYVDAAAYIGIEVAALKAVTRVEAKQFGFLDNGYPVILFERHVFYKKMVELRGKAAADSASANHPDICNPVMGGYLGKEAEIKRYKEASAIDSQAANLSFSIGLFQIMTFNFKQAGFNSPEDYIAAMFESEANQLKAFCSYIKNDRDGSLLRALQNHDWTAFAKEYNGPAYNRQTPAYDVRLKSEYLKALNK